MKPGDVYSGGGYIDIVLAVDDKGLDNIIATAQRQLGRGDKVLVFTIFHNISHQSEATAERISSLEMLPKLESKDFAELTCEVIAYERRNE